MTKEKPGLVKTPLDELTYKVNGLAMQVMHELRSGHKEQFYQRRLAELCRAAGLQTEMEQRVEVWIDDSMVGYLYLDLWIEGSLVVECKALSHDLTDHELHQVLVYLAATGSPVGMLYNFGRSTLEFKRVLRPVNMQDWQKFLYRVIWTPHGVTLPPVDSLSASGPIRFSVISSLANVPPVEAVPSPVRESVTESVSSPVRDSATESVSTSVRDYATKSVPNPVRDSVTESVPSPVRESATESAYSKSGVSIDAGNRAVALMKESVKSTYTPAVLAGIGSFGGLYDASALKRMRSPVLVASTDGVGTKVKLAASVGRQRSVGHDIVNHCINDILVQGARPLFFMDYFATARLNPAQTAEVVTGMAEACQEAGMVLLGGETAEMPGVYQSNEFDVAGTIVGVLERDDILPRKNMQAGDVLIGLPSSGPHTNGYSLLRQVFADTPLDTVFPELGCPLADALLAPHRSYLSILYSLLSHIKALAHLTGGAFIENIPRVLPEDLNAEIQLGSWPVPPLWNLVQQKGNISTEEMYRVFNMGIGMVAIVDKAQAIEIQERIPQRTFIIGELTEGERKTVLV
ncbi:MAG TPA: phosphoribosylformylglycinamidine cyclo-ligase [Anaerolineales bacterium]|nr:phosphoribosylformylglycinamidine cyclo-ligase [Anaerolineales bacterium]